MTHALIRRLTNEESHLAWLILIVAGLFECAWAVGLKYSDGFTRPLVTALTLLAMVVSVWLLAIAMKTIPVGTAYAVWTGIGAVGVALLGMWLFNEPRELARIFFLAMIVGGIVGLKVVSGS